MNCRSLAITCCGLFVLGLVPSGSAWTQESGASKSDSDQVKRSDQLYAEFDQTGKSLDIRAKGGQAYQWQAEPLFRFSSEGMNFGSVYVWNDSQGRLALVGTIGSIPISGSDVEFVEFHLMKPAPIEPLKLSSLAPKTWQPRVEELQLKEIPDAPGVATGASTRMRQMRGLARRFSAEMIDAGQTNKLRLLPQPLYRYQNSNQEFDGALFAFVWDKGTDPEVLLRIETKLVGDEVHWAYQPMRFTYREVNASLDQAKIWEAAEFHRRDQARQTTPYVTTLTRVIP